MKLSEWIARLQTALETYGDREVDLRGNYGCNASAHDPIREVRPFYNADGQLTAVVIALDLGD